MTRKIITVDGLAATGKSTLALALAKRLGFVFFSTGIVYRALGYLLYKEKIDPDLESEVVRTLKGHTLSLSLDAAKVAHIALNQHELGKEIFSPQVSDYTSRSSRHGGVREQLLKLQRESFSNVNLVVEGRDAGSVIFPAADLKFFITASNEIRRARRIRQLYGVGSDIPAERLKEIDAEIDQRDRRDQSRTLSPALPASDAVIFDNSALSVEESISKLLLHCRERGIGEP